MKTLKLTFHKPGYWCRKINGKTCYFGRRYGNETDANMEYLLQRPYLEAGLEPPKDSEGVTLLEALDKFLIVKRQKMEREYKSC